MADRQHARDRLNKGWHDIHYLVCQPCLQCDPFRNCKYKCNKFGEGRPGCGLTSLSWRIFFVPTMYWFHFTCTHDHVESDDYPEKLCGQSLIPLNRRAIACPYQMLHSNGFITNINYFFSVVLV